VARYEASGFIDKDRNRPAPFADRHGDLADLLGAVRPGVAGVWRQRRDRPPFNFICWPHSFHNSPFYRRNLIFYPGAHTERCHEPRARDHRECGRAYRRPLRAPPRATRPFLPRRNWFSDSRSSPPRSAMWSAIKSRWRRAHGEQPFPRTKARSPFVTAERIRLLSGFSLENGLRNQLMTLPGNPSWLGSHFSTPLQWTNRQQPGSRVLWNIARSRLCASRDGFAGRPFAEVRRRVLDGVDPELEFIHPQ
jgi:hypothetical protein